MQEYLSRRLKELDQGEKSAWAVLNYVLGQKEEVERLLRVCGAPPAETGVKPEEIQNV